MASGKIIGKVTRPKNSLVWVEGDGTVKSRILPQLTRGKQHGSNTMDGVKSKAKKTKAKSKGSKSKTKSKAKK